MLNALFADHVGSIVEHTLEKASVRLEDTDLLPAINDSNKPVLIVNSDVDNVSPPTYFAFTDNQNVHQLLFRNHSHSSLMVFDGEDVIHIEEWLSQFKNRQ